MPHDFLKAGERNHVKVYFLNKYRTDGVGLHTFVQKDEGEQYIKTRFEADYCRYVFPCFDQPDLKATWQLSCETEEDWTIISNAPEDAEPSDELMTQVKDDCETACSLFMNDEDTEPICGKQVIMQRSKAMATHVCNIIAGPFQYHEKRSEGYPVMRIYARAS